MKYFFSFIVAFSLFFIQSIDAQTGEVRVNESQEVKDLVELKSEMDKALVYSKIQIYSGDRAIANEVAMTYESLFKNSTAEIIDETPNYKVWVGNYKTRLEADKAWLRIKKEFPSAFIFKPIKR